MEVAVNVEQPTPGVTEEPPTSDQPTVEEPTEPTQGEPVTPEEPARTTGEPPGAEPTAGPKKGKTAQDRIQELVAEREYYKGLYEGAKKPPVAPEQPPETPPQQAAPPVEPKPEDFEGATAWDDYEKAMRKWVIAQAKYEAIQEINQKTAQQVSQAAVAEQVRKIVSAHNERMTKYAETDPEINEIVKDPTLPFSEPMRAAVMFNDEGPRLIKYLHEHKDEARRIYNLAPMVQGPNGTWVLREGGNPFRVAMEIGRIAGILNTQPPTKPTKPKSHTPEPHQPVGGSSGGGGPSGDLAALAETDPKEYLRRVREVKA